MLQEGHTLIQTGLLPLTLATACLLATAAPAFGQRGATRGVQGRPAPSWQVEEWFNLPDGVESIDVSDFEGKVVYLYGFQSWCPGCHSHGFPTLKKLSEEYADADDVTFVAIQTTFEGFGTNTAESAKAMGKRYDLDIPIGHSGSNGQRSKVMRAYRTGGTPWTIVIDKDGVVRYNDFRISSAAGTRLIEKLRAESGKPTMIETLPKERGGQDVVGKKWPNLEYDAEIDRVVVPKKPKATLYRWWTTGCPWCEASLPAIEKLRAKYEDEGLRTVGVFHPKPPRAVTEEEVAKAAEALGYRGDLAIDRDWSELRSFYLDTGDRKATSVSFLVDADGQIRFVHPGPVFYPSENPNDARENADYELLERAIQQLLQVESLQTK